MFFVRKKKTQYIKTIYCVYEKFVVVNTINCDTIELYSVSEMKELYKICSIFGGKVS